MKKLLKLFIASFLVAMFVLAPSTFAQDKSKVSVTTSFLYDMVSQLSGDAFDLDLLIPAGSDPHLYQAQPQDVQKIVQADYVLYHGLDLLTIV